MSKQNENIDMHSVKVNLEFVGSQERFQAFLTAKTLIDPLVEKHGLTEVRSGAPFQVTYTNTPVEQHLEHILRVADWLLG